jgi:hypothetical protein
LKQRSRSRKSRKSERNFWSGLQAQWTKWRTGSTKDSSQIVVLDQVATNKFWKIPKTFPVGFYLLLSAIATISVAIAAIFSLIYPSTTAKCEAKLKSVKSSKWQTNRGIVVLEPKNDVLTGKYIYENINSGKMLGKITGKFNNDILYFDWQESGEISKVERKGQGSVFFQDHCQEFLGSFGNSGGNWRGTNK